MNLTLLANPWTWVIILVALGASHGAVGYKAFRLGQDDVIAENAKLVDVEVRTRDAALAAASEAIAQIEVRNVTIRQQAETVVRENVVYRDCRHTPDGLRLVNEALGAPAQSPDPSRVP